MMNLWLKKRKSIMFWPSIKYFFSIYTIIPNPKIYNLQTHSKQMYTKLAKAETPVNIFKVQIRRKHRQQIRRDIMNQFQQLQGFRTCLESICDMAHRQLIQMTNLEDQKITHQVPETEDRNIVYSSNNKSEDRHKCRDGNVSDGNPWDFGKISKLAQELSFLLNIFPDKWIQQIVSNEQEYGHQPGRIIENLENFIKIYIPHLIYVVEEVQRAQSKQLEYQNNKYVWPGFQNEDYLLPQVLQQVSLAQINTKKLVENLISILIKLSYIHDLHPCFIFTNPCHTHSNSPFYPYIYHACYELQPLRLLTRNLMSFILPQEDFYASVISLGNILHHLNAGDKNQHTFRHTDIRRFTGIDGGQGIYLHAYQVLLDADVESILAVMLSRLITEEENYSENRQSSQVDQVSEEVLVWFINAYSKFLYARSLPIYRLQLLTNNLQSYIYNQLRILQNSQATNSRGTGLTGKSLVLFKHITSIIEYCGIKLDNIVIINTVIPLLRRNWHETATAKLWLYLSFNRDYDMSELINIHYQQVHISYNRDKVTVKNHRFYQNCRDSVSNEDEREDQKEEQLNQFENQITFRPTIPIDPLAQIFQQIFSVVIQNHGGRFRKRNEDLFEGIFNIILQMKQIQAKSLWRSLCTENEGQEARIFQIKEIQPTIQNIENFLDNTSQ